MYKIFKNVNIFFEISSSHKNILKTNPTAVFLWNKKFNSDDSSVKFIQHNEHTQSEPDLKLGKQVTNFNVPALLSSSNNDLGTNIIPYQEDTNIPKVNDFSNKTKSLLRRILCGKIPPSLNDKLDEILPTTNKFFEDLEENEQITPTCKLFVTSPSAGLHLTSTNNSNTVDNLLINSESAVNNKLNGLRDQCPNLLKTIYSSNIAKQGDVLPSFTQLINLNRVNNSALTIKLYYSTKYYRPKKALYDWKRGILEARKISGTSMVNSGVRANGDQESVAKNIVGSNESKQKVENDLMDKLIYSISREYIKRQNRTIKRRSYLPKLSLTKKYDFALKNNNTCYNAIKKDNLINPGTITDNLVKAIKNFEVLKHLQPNDVEYSLEDTNKNDESKEHQTSKSSTPKDSKLPVLKKNFTNHANRTDREVKSPTVTSKIPISNPKKLIRIDNENGLSEMFTFNPKAKISKKKIKRQSLFVEKIKPSHTVKKNSSQFLGKRFARKMEKNPSPLSLIIKKNSRHLCRNIQFRPISTIQNPNPPSSKPQPLDPSIKTNQFSISSADSSNKPNASTNCRPTSGLRRQQTRKIFTSPPILKSEIPLILWKSPNLNEQLSTATIEQAKIPSIEAFNLKIASTGDKGVTSLRTVNDLDPGLINTIDNENNPYYTRVPTKINKKKTIPKTFKRQMSTKTQDNKISTLGNGKTEINSTKSPTTNNNVLDVNQEEAVRKKTNVLSLNAAKNIFDCSKLTMIPGKLFIQFKCKKCNTRNSKYISKQAYRKGVVIIQCNGCKNNHLIADNLKWFGNKNRNIEDILAENGETVKKMMVDGTFELCNDSS